VTCTLFKKVIEAETFVGGERVVGTVPEHPVIKNKKTTKNIQEIVFIFVILLILIYLLKILNKKNEKVSPVTFMEVVMFNFILYLFLVWIST